MIVLLFLLFAAFSAFIEAVLYARRGAESFRLNEHLVMVLQRAAVVLLPTVAVMLYRLTGSHWYVASQTVPALLLFPLVHDEAYNFTRLWLAQAAVTGTAAAVWGVKVPGWVCWLLSPLGADGTALARAWQQYRYGYQSPTTTARNDFNGHQRTWLALLGLAAWGLAAYLLL